MTTRTPQQTAEAFSTHRFDEVLDQLAADVSWVLVGQSTLVGRDAVSTACRETAAELEGTTTTFSRLRTVVGDDAVAVDAIGHYVEPDGSTSVVSSCDLYEFDAGQVVAITSYAVELADD
jgi:ketosteroid isomerase-like protein